MDRADDFRIGANTKHFAHRACRRRERMNHQIHAIGVYPHASDECRELLVLGNFAGTLRTHYNTLDATSVDRVLTAETWLRSLHQNGHSWTRQVPLALYVLVR